MKIEIGSVSNTFRPLVTFFKRYHTILFFLIVSTGLFVAIFVLLGAVQRASVPGTSSKAIDSGFDEATIERIKNLEDRETSQPGNRSNPFVE